MQALVPALGILIAAAFGLQAHADVVAFGLNGAGFSGHGLLTVSPNVAPRDPNPDCGKPANNPCRTDPVGAWRITAISGTFSDATDGISNAAITGVVEINPMNERDPKFDPLVPSSLSFIDFPGGYLSYNNLFFPKGSPIDCDFPFAGSFVDVFGMAFTVAGGYTANVWGDGDMFGPGTTTFGVGVSNAKGPLAYVFNGVNAAVPEPATWMLMLLGVGGLGFGLRRARRELTAA
ncbi:MAG: PEP-CTERM sorting domain-containing protein [Caulobacteraceae bacterium]